MTPDNLVESNKIILGLSKSVDEYTDRLAANGQRLGKVFQNIVANSTDINNSIKRSLELSAGLNTSWGNYGKLVKNLDQIKLQNLNIQASKEAFYLELRKKGLSITRADFDQKSKDLQNQKDAVDELQAQLSIQEKIRDDASQSASARQQAGLQAWLIEKDLVDELQKELDLEKDLIDEIGEQEAIKLRLLDAEIKAVEESEKLTQKLVDQNKKYEIANELLEKTTLASKQLSKYLNFIGLGSALKVATDYYFRIDKYSTDIANNSGVTKGFAQQTTKLYEAAASNLAVVNSNLDKSILTVKAQAEAQNELQVATGQSALYTQQSLQSQIYLTKQLGLSADEAAKINQLGLINGKSTSEVTENIADQVAGFNKAKGLNLNIRDVLKDVSKVSGVIAVNYKNNPKAIAQAVSQAKALGVSLQDAAAASRSLLDFESSIENELEAELLTGKAWNLEKARALALSGDTAGALEEELKNVGSLAEFAEQNTVTKEAEAKAVGMTVDQLSDALRQQEVLKTSTKETQKAQEEILKNIKGSANEAKYRAELNAATNGAELLAKEGLVNKQMEYEASMDRVKDAFGEIVSGPLGAMITGMTKFLSTSEGLKTTLGIAAGFMTLMAIKSALIAAADIAAAFATFNVAGGTAGLAILAAAGISAGVGIAAASSVPDAPVKTISDGLIAPTGEMVIQTPAGDLVKPNRNDSIIATTNPGGLLNGGGNNNSGNSRAESLLAAILESVSKPAGVYMDSMRVGTSLGMSRSAYA